jgi:uncharacterized protein (UPF0264 family)
MERGEIYSEIRYAIRLTERTARLYRKVQTFGVALSIVSGGTAIANLVTKIDPSVATLGAAGLAIAGAILIAVKPGDKAAQNEADVRRYRALQAKFPQMQDAEAHQALLEARQSDAPEIEALRPVVFNDIARENGVEDRLMDLTTKQRLLAALA